MAQSKQEKLTAAAGIAAAAVYTATVGWLHYQQLASDTGYYYSDIPAHMEGRAMGNTGFSLVTVMLRGVFALGGNLGTAVFLAAAGLLAVLLFAWAIRREVGDITPGAALLWSVAANLCQAAWMPGRGYWYFGAITGTIYHNTTYILLQPLALIAYFLYLDLAQRDRTKFAWGRWAALTVLLTVATAVKPSYLFAFAPALLIALVIDLIRTRGRALAWEVWMGCTVVPGILLCLIQAKVLFTGGDDSGMAVIFTTDFDPDRVLWGIFNYNAKWGLVRSLVFVGAVFVLLCKRWWGAYRYRFGALLFAVALCEGICLTETGSRMYDGNLWWGAFVCYDILMLESLIVWLRQLKARPRTLPGTVGTAVCGGALAWHVVSGIVFLGLMLAGISYAVMLGTEAGLLREMWGVLS
ncbi:hypothetical protein [Gemmiger sp.]